MLSPLKPTPHYLLLYRERMKLPFMSEQCEQMLKISNEFVRLQVSYDEYLCMKVLLLLSTGNYILTQQDFSDLCKCSFSGIKTSQWLFCCINYIALNQHHLTVR